MASRTQPSPHRQQIASQLTLAGLILLVAFALFGLVRLVGEVHIESSPRLSTQPQPLPSGRQEGGTHLGAVQLESWRLIRPYLDGYHDCAAVERIIDPLEGEMNRCYEAVSLPPISQLVGVPFYSTEDYVRLVTARPERLVYMPSPTRRSGADTTLFHDNGRLFQAVWIAGDCTPRIFDGQGGYWQMPVSPSFGRGENVPYGPGYLFTLPADWQQAWAVDPAAAAPWQLCAASSFWYRQP